MGEMKAGENVCYFFFLRPFEGYFRIHFLLKEERSAMCSCSPGGSS